MSMGNAIVNVNPIRMYVCCANMYCVCICTILYKHMVSVACQVNYRLCECHGSLTCLLIVCVCPTESVLHV